MVLRDGVMRMALVAAVIGGLAACESAPQPAPGTSYGSGSGGQMGAGGRGVGTENLSGMAGSATEAQRQFAVEVGDRVLFETDSHSLTAAATATLDKQSAWLKRYPQWRITIEGHADARGTREYNLALGDRRATAVRNYLVNQGIPAQRITTLSYGKERPVALGSNEAAWAENRRAVTVLGDARAGS
jgi:peptidoglycan-associated lipoprotein